MDCRICGDSDRKNLHRIKEMMHGTGDVFDYFECAGCGCLQIASFPEDMSAYYRSDYYSIRARNRAKRFLVNMRINALISGRGLIGRALLKVRPPESDESLSPSAPVKKTDRLLDVGCGNGGYLFKLHELGFSNLHGIDPYMSPHDVRTSPFPLERVGLPELSPELHSFDVILMGHVLEHIADQQETLQHLKALLAPRGVAMIRIPMIPCFAWEHYGTDWVQLDAPRHFYIHTVESLGLLADDAGLRIDDVEYDSDAFQFWGSEQYRRGIPLSAPNSWSIDQKRSPFTPAQIAEYEGQAKKLNREARGDQVLVRLSHG